MDWLKLNSSSGETEEALIVRLAELIWDKEVSESNYIDEDKFYMFSIEMDRANSLTHWMNVKDLWEVNNIKGSEIGAQMPSILFSRWIIEYLTEAGWIEFKPLT